MQVEELQYEVRITKLPNGKSLAVTSVLPRDMGKAIGRDGRNPETMRFLVERYFQIDNVTIR